MYQLGEEEEDFQLAVWIALERHIFSPHIFHMDNGISILKNDINDELQFILISEDKPKKIHTYIQKKMENTFIIGLICAINYKIRKWRK